MRGGRFRQGLRWGAVVVPPLLVLVVCLWLVLNAPPSVRQGGMNPAAGKGAEMIAQARKAIARGDGIDAEMKLRAALEQGARPADVNAYMGEAFLAQNDHGQARQWLAQGAFSQNTAAEGWRALAQLEKLDGNLPASGHAYDKALAITPDDASLWVEIGRLRYAGGQHRLAIEASDHALRLGPEDVRALEFRGQLVRDRDGYLAAIPWFERATVMAPQDVSALLEYAATLGEIGRASECLAVTRRVLQINPKNPRAYYLQAVLAARAGNYPLARGLLARTGGKLDGQPGVQMLRGVVEIAAGNPAAAAEALETVLRLRPDNLRARELLLRAILMAGQYRYATLRFADDIADGGASPYMLTSVARAWEVLGDRHHAGELLDRAAVTSAAPLRVFERAAVSGDARQSDYDAQALAGDAQLVEGNGQAAQQHYLLAAQIRMPQSLFERRFAAYALAHDARGAGELVDGYLAQHPASRAALRAAAQLAVRKGDLTRTRAILIWLRDNGGRGDVELLCDLAVTEAGLGDLAAAQDDALAAYRLQRSNPLAARALGAVYMAMGNRPDTARALLAKAQAILGAVTPPTAARTPAARAR